LKDPGPTDYASTKSREAQALKQRLRDWRRFAHDTKEYGSIAGILNAVGSKYTDTGADQALKEGDKELEEEALTSLSKLQDQVHALELDTLLYATSSALSDPSLTLTVARAKTKEAVLWRYDPEQAEQMRRTGLLLCYR
jgi:hypothetical protein